MFERRVIEEIKKKKERKNKLKDAKIHTIILFSYSFIVSCLIYHMHLFVVAGITYLNFEFLLNTFEEK